MAEKTENETDQIAGNQQPDSHETNSETPKSGKVLKEVLRSASSAGAKALHYAAEMSKTKWFAVVAIVIVGLVLAKLACQGYHPSESTGPIEVRSSDGVLLLKTDANGKTIESIVPERKTNP